MLHVQTETTGMFGLVVGPAQTAGTYSALVSVHILNVNMNAGYN